MNGGNIYGMKWREKFKFNLFIFLYFLVQRHPLLVYNVCQWPGCEAYCESFQQFVQ